VTDERTRIARELHDVVAHAISVIAVQAGAAEAALDSDPQRARGPLASTQRTAHEALEEMRRLVGMLRADGQTASLRPPPGLADVPELLGELLPAGLRVSLDGEGTQVRLPPGQDLAGYRIVQDAATTAASRSMPSSPPMTRILIADDEALIRDGLRMILEAEEDLEVVGVAADGAAAVEQTRRLTPDVVLMDIRMPQMDGIEATRRVVQMHPGTRVIVLTTFDLDEYLYAAMKAGASGFLLKDVGREGLVAGVRAVTIGDALLAPPLVRRLLDRFVDRPAPGRTAAALEVLSARELEVLRLVARGDTNGEIAAGLFLSGATVKSHIASLLRKLGARDRVQLVVLAYESGLVEPGDA